MENYHWVSYCTQIWQFCNTVESPTFFCPSQETQPPSVLVSSCRASSISLSQRLPKRSIFLCRSLELPISLCPSLKPPSSLHSSLRPPPSQLGVTELRLLHNLQQLTFLSPGLETSRSSGTEWHPFTSDSALLSRYSAPPASISALLARVSVPLDHNNKLRSKYGTPPASEGVLLT